MGAYVIGFVCQSNTVVQKVKAADNGLSAAFTFWTKERFNNHAYHLKPKFAGL